MSITILEIFTLNLKAPNKFNPKVEFGFNLDDYVVDSDTIRSGDSFGKILFENHIGYGKIEELAKEGKDTFDVSFMNVNSSIHSESSGTYFVYIIISISDTNRNI